MRHFQRFFQPPAFDDEDIALRGRLINALILAAFVAAPLLLIGNLLDENPSSFIFVNSVLVFGLAIWLRSLLHQGKVRLVSILWLILSSVLVTTSAIYLGTVQATNTAIFVINIAVAGLLLDRRTVIIVTVYNSLAVLGLIWAQRTEILPSQAFATTTGISIWFNYTALFVSMAILMSASVQVLSRSIEKARHELEEHRRAEHSLHQRDVILEAATFAAQRFLQSEDWRSEINSVLEYFGKVTGCSHVFIFENHALPDGTPVISQRFEWTAPGISPELEDPTYQNIPMDLAGPERFYELMTTGEVFWGNINNFEPEDAEFYRQHGLKSIIDIPIFVGDQWWGVLGFDDEVKVRSWLPVEVDALKIAAGTLGAAIYRQVTDVSLRQRDSIMQAVNFATQQFLQSADWHSNIHAVLEVFGEATHSSHVYIFERHWLLGGIPALSQRYEWIADGVQPDIDDPTFQNIDLSHIESVPWYLDLSQGKICYGNLDTLPPEEAKFFVERGVKSIIEAPIIIAERWWGVIGFDDCTVLREWSPAEVDAIKTAASTLSAVIQRQVSNAVLLQRDSIMQAATFAAKIFLQSANWRDQIRAVLEQLGKATGSSHVFIFENHSLPDGKRGTSQRYEWAAPGVPSDLDNPLYQNMPVYDVRTRRWYAAMTAGEAFYGNIETLNSEEREIYIRRGLLTFIDVPILVSGEWWGIIGFDDYLRVRNWTQVEVEAIKIAASTLGSAIERQMSDAALRESESRHRTELEQRVQERTQQLQDALQEIESVSYTASHDLRAPLRAVDGYSSILLQEYGDSLNPQQSEYLTRIKQASRRMGNLLDDLIQLIRYSRQPMKIEIVNLSELATQVKNELHNRYPDRVVRVEIQTGLAAAGDKSLLGVLLLELLDNAWKFTETTPDPIIKFGIQEQDGERVFFVRDNGIGIDMTYASRLFRTFEQLYAPGEIEGTGMGLATVQRIIQRHHGRVWVEGKLNEGATFYFTLPE